MSDTLMHLGHESVLATSAKSAYDYLARRHTFEVILLDLQLGEERSESVIQKLEEDGYSIPPIVILPAQPDAELKTAAEVVRAKAVVNKPATLAEIGAALDRLAA